MRGFTSLRVQLGVFSLLFAGGMWMSKVAQPLHFEHQGAMLAFGVGYAVMAVAGGLSFVWGALADRIGGVNAVRLGGTVYAIGIAGRIYTEMAPSIVFSAIAGAGASLALVGIRPWVRSFARDDEIPSIVATRNMSNQIGVLVGTLGAALIFAVSGQSNQGHVSALIVAPALVLGGVVWLVLAARVRRNQEPSAPQETNEPPRHKATRLTVKLAILGVLSGSYVSLVAPYIPLILVDSGLSNSSAALVVTGMSLAQVASTAALTRAKTSTRPFRLFVVSELATGAVTVGAAAALGFSATVIAGLFIMRAALLALASAAEETIQYAVIPAAAVGFVFGISQTAFLAGDALGGALGAYLWTNTGASSLIVIAGAITVANAVLFPLLLRGEPKSENSHVK